MSGSKEDYFDITHNIQYTVYGLDFDGKPKDIHMPASQYHSTTINGLSKILFVTRHITDYIEKNDKQDSSH